MYVRASVICYLGLVALTFSPLAHAGDCASGSTHTGTCTPSGGTADICAPAAGGTLLECDTRANYTSGTIYGALVYAVYDDLLTGGHTECGDDYCIWGDDVNNDAFCCAFDAGDLVKLNVVGTSEDDSIYFVNGSFNLEPYTTSDFVGQVIANDGDDIVEGSYCTDSEYTDELFGGPGDDEIWGRDGRNNIHGDDGIDTIHGGSDIDHIWGDPGDDIIHGGASADVIRGGSDHDTIDGDGGNDEIYGDAGNDDIRGGNDDDTIHGGPGDDTLCGDAQDDILLGDAGDDELWGGADLTGDFANGYIGTDTCDAETEVNCTHDGGMPATGPCH